MASLLDRVNLRALRWTVAVAAVCTAVLIWSGVAAGASAGSSLAGPPSAAPQITPGQDFQDVFPSDPFYPYLHNLFGAGVVSGYACQPGGPNDPCVPPTNLPYYHPGSTVSRLQMTKFIDNGRRNIANGVGTSLTISSTVATSLSVINTHSGAGQGVGVYAECGQVGAGCYALEAASFDGNYGAYLEGGWGNYLDSTNSNWPGVDAHGYGAGGYGIKATSDVYRGDYVSRGSTSFTGLYVDKASGEPASSNVADFAAGVLVEGNLTVSGSKSGYVVDAMQNVDSTALEPGDLVVIVGSSAPVLGQIPVVTVRKATTAYDSHLAGVVDQALYVPDAATKAAYAAQQDAQRAAEVARDAALKVATQTGGKPDMSKISWPAITVTDAQGSVHGTDATQVPGGSYLNVVTLGAYKAVKADASFGAIHAGDMLTTSPHAGYAQRADDGQIKFGSVLGKALADLPNGTGLIPLMVTLK